MPRKSDIDAQFYALRPRMGRGSGGGAVTVTIPPHTHHASEIIADPEPSQALLSGDDAEEQLYELGAEKLARSGEQPMLGTLDMDHHNIQNVLNIEVEVDASVGNNATVGNNETIGGDLSMTGGVGRAVGTGFRKIHMVGEEADGEARIEAVKALAFTAVAPTPEVGRCAWDSVEKTFVVFVQSGA